MSALSLVLANLVTIGFADWQGWDARNIVWIYWAQGVIVGFFQWHRILDLNQFTTEGLSDDGQPLEATEQTKRHHAIFFVVVYGVIHLYYLAAVLTRWPPTAIPDILICILVFFINHAFSYLHHRRDYIDWIPNIATVGNAPFIRVIPMHIIICLGPNVAPNSRGFLFLSLALKTVIDVFIHTKQHADLRRSDRTTH